MIGYRSLRVAGVDPAGAGAAAGPVRLRRLGHVRHPGGVHCGLRGLRGHPVRAASSSGRSALGAVWAGGYDDPPPVPLDAAITFAPSGDVVVAALAAVDRGGTSPINAIHLDRLPELRLRPAVARAVDRSVANVTRTDVVEFLDLAAALPVVTRSRSSP